MPTALLRFIVAAVLGACVGALASWSGHLEHAAAQGKAKEREAKAPPADGEFTRYGIYQTPAPRAAAPPPVATRLPLELKAGERIAFIGATLMERAQDHAFFEALLHQQHPEHRLVIRNL